VGKKPKRTVELNRT